MGGATFHLLLVENTLGECLPSKVILLLSKMRRDVGYGRGDAEGLV